MMGHERRSRDIDHHCLVVAGLGVWFVVAHWDQANKVATAVSALAPVMQPLAGRIQAFTPNTSSKPT
jgi:hypothetical protein